MRRYSVKKLRGAHDQSHGHLGAIYLQDFAEYTSRYLNSVGNTYMSEIT